MDTPSFEDTLPVSNQSKPSAPTPPAFEDTVPVNDVSDEDKETYGTTKQQLLTAAESAATGFAGPLATAAEAGLSKLGVPGLTPEEQEARAKVNPKIETAAKLTGLGAGLLTGTGELGLLARGAEAVVGATKLAEGTSLAARAGAAAIKGFIEMSGLAAGDEVSKQILGRGDPEAPVASALSNIGVQGLIGSATGGLLTFGGAAAGSTLKKISDTKAGNYIGKFLEDFGNGWKNNLESPNRIDAVYRELSDFHNSTSSAAGEVYGSEGLKTQAIERLTQKIKPEQITSHLDEVKNVLEKAPKAIKAEPLFTEAVSDWSSKVSAENATPADVFKATDLLKRQFQEWGEYNKAMVPLKEVPFRNTAKNVGHGLKESLENSKTWEEAGDLQKEVNKAFSEYVGPLKDFRRRFTTKIESSGTHDVDPQKIRTYINQLGKTGADISEEIRPKMLKNYIEAAESYRNKISDLHALKGIESPLDHASLDLVKRTYDEITPGGDFADKMFHGGMSKLVGGLSGAIGGGAVGAHEGLGGLGSSVSTYAGKALGEAISPYIENTIGRPMKSHLIPGVLKVMEAGRFSAIGEALEHADNIARGNSAIEFGVNSLFTGGKLTTHKLYEEADEKTKERIKKFISDGGLNQQIQNSLQKTDPKSAQPLPHFAEGGLVEKQPVPKDADSSQEASKLSQVYPEQSMLMSMAKGRVTDYLNSVRPVDSAPALPFDKKPKDPHKDKNYSRALQIAVKPLSILKNIQNGTLDMQTLKHMTQMWPEVHSQLSKKLTEKMAKAQMDGGKMPPYHVRQGLAMFIGAPLDSNMTPSSIQAAQAVFAKQKAALQSAPASGQKQNTSKLGQNIKQHQTSTQAAAERQLTRKF